MIVRAADIAVYDKESGVVVSGGVESLEVFASFFDFEIDAESAVITTGMRLVVLIMLQMALYQ